MFYVRSLSGAEIPLIKLDVLGKKDQACTYIDLFLGMFVWIYILVSFQK